MLIFDLHEWKSSAFIILNTHQQIVLSTTQWEIVDRMRPVGQIKDLGVYDDTLSHRQVYKVNNR